MALCLAAWCASGVGDAGGQFTTTLNVPPDSATRSIGSNTQLNLRDGGAIGPSFNAGRPAGGSINVEVNIFGGSAGSLFQAHSGSTVNILGGSVADLFFAFDGSTVNFAGGSIGDDFNAFTGSSINIVGGEFRLDGARVEGLDSVGNTRAFNLPGGSVLSGTLADGTPFAFSSHDLDTFPDGTITLKVAALPAVGSPQIMLPADLVPRGIRAGQTLIVAEGGGIGDNFNAGPDSTIILAGGRVGRNFEAVGAQVNISAGSIGDSFDAFDGSTVNISGGSLGSRFAVYRDSTLNLSGGSVTGPFVARGGSSVNLLGTQFLLDNTDITSSLAANSPLSILDRDVTLSGLLVDGGSFAFDFFGDHALPERLKPRACGSARDRSLGPLVEFHGIAVRLSASLRPWRAAAATSTCNKRAAWRVPAGVQLPRSLSIPSVRPTDRSSLAGDRI